MKLCRNCNETKKKEMFCRRSASIDGLSAKCRKCQSDYDKLRANNPDRVEARKKYSESDNGKETAKRARKKWAANNKGKIYELTKSYRERNPNKSKAHGKVSYEVRLGNLTSKPCEVCNVMPTNAHHDDYSKPLDVRWLCSKHHKQWHKENGEGKNP